MQAAGFVSTPFVMQVPLGETGCSCPFSAGLLVPAMVPPKDCLRRCILPRVNTVAA